MAKNLVPFFPNIDASWKLIAHRPIASIDGSHKFFSFKGRTICLLHTLATPLKAFSGLGRLAILTNAAALQLLSVLTLNSHPNGLVRVITSVTDVAVGAVLLPVALIANVIRGLAGTLLHPGAMIRDERALLETESFNRYAAEHPVLYGTLVNY